MDVALLGHEHLFVTIDVFDHPSGRKQVQRRCVCGLEDRVRFAADGRAEEVRVRFHSGWLDPADLFHLNLPFALCPDCAASGHPCERCGDLGVVAASGDSIALR